MGTQGRKGAARLFFGSVAEGVLRRAPAPVLVVPRGRARHDGSKRFAGPVLGAIELGPTDRGDARRVARAAAALGAPLTLVHAVPITAGPPWIAARIAEHDRSRTAGAHARLDALAKEAGARTRVVLGRPSEEIAATAADLKASLIVLVLRRGRGLFGPRQGTTTYQVLCCSPIPVLALPAGQES
jgi:nucleotide-binding universal stress UspA family protein